ncbi:MAG TPA: regulatory iron-sulfur-containing complex subunit RicT [Desulfopila sp.]|nr:regulatory iron-sulfur-containing complex subunit RicT [Desulfopila sp.]
MAEEEKQTTLQDDEALEEQVFYRIRFRKQGQEFTAEATLAGLVRGDLVMVKTDHGLEPAMVVGGAPACRDSGQKRRASYVVARRLTQEEHERFDKLPVAEESGFAVCCELIDKHRLEMSLVRVEKFFNGSKIIFYFTADNRVDFRELVKDLVQEFRTRVEMRQVGVRHETKMIGGLGTCGRELCCSSFMKKFDSVSIKMAKEQDLPLNPSKISGVCNRLLCCLTYEFPIYHEQRKKMPKVGSRVLVDGVEYKVKRQLPLQQQLMVIGEGGEERLLDKESWLAAERLKGGKLPRKKKKNK